MTEFACPEVTLYGWQDVKIQLLLTVGDVTFFQSWHIKY